MFLSQYQRYRKNLRDISNIPESLPGTPGRIAPECRTGQVIPEAVFASEIPHLLPVYPDDSGVHYPLRSAFIGRESEDSQGFARIYIEDEDIEKLLASVPGMRKWYGTCCVY